MKYYILLFSFLNFLAFGQGVIPVQDFNNFFLSFQDGYFLNIEVQPIKDFKAGDKLVAYIDTRGNLRLYD